MHPNHPCVHIKRSLELRVSDKRSCGKAARLDRLCGYASGKRAQTRNSFDESLRRLGIAPKVVKRDSWCNFRPLFQHVGSRSLSKHASELLLV
jgi:hypothetical protein